MLLPRRHRLPIPPSFRKPLAVRDPANPDAPGLEGNKNGPPGPEGNKKGPPSAATSTQELESLTSLAFALETAVSSSDNPASLSPSASSTRSPDTSPPSVVITTVSPSPSSAALASAPSVVITTVSPSPSSTPLASAASGTSLSATSSVEPDVNASSVGFSTSAQSSISGSPSSPAPDVSFPAKMTMRTSFTYTNAATPTQGGMVSQAPNSSAPSENNALLPGQKAGVAIGSIGMFQSPCHYDRPISQANNREAGFVGVLTLIFLLFKWRRGKRPEAGMSYWPSRGQTPDTMSDSLLSVEPGSNDGAAWDYRATFARPMMERMRRSLPKSLRPARINPLSLNPVTPRTTETSTPSRKSFASSFFHRPFTASTPRLASHPSSSQEQPRSKIDLQLTLPSLSPLTVALPSPGPSDMSGRSTKHGYSDTNDPPRPLVMPPPTLRLPRHTKNIQMTMASAESDSLSVKAAPGWVRYHYPMRSRRGGVVPQESRLDLPLPPVPISAVRD